jgi:hypothetical protein
MTKKVFDAVVVIDIIAECQFSALLRLWSKNPRYELWIPTEIDHEVCGSARNDLDALIKDKIVNIFPLVEQSELITIQLRKPKLSLNDCSVYYHCSRIPGAIALTNDKRLRQLLESNKITVHGTKAIYEKIIKEQSFPIQEIEQRFALLKQDSRTFPS